jgi:hypothetical protein
VLFKDAPSGAAEALASLPGVLRVKEGGPDGSWILECAPGSDPREEVFRTAASAGWVLLELGRLRGATLEDIFVRLTTADTAAESHAAEAPADPTDRTDRTDPTDPSQEVVS